MKKQNLVVLICIFVLIAVVAVLAAVVPQSRTLSGEKLTLEAVTEATAAPVEETAAPVEPTAAPVEPTAAPVEATEAPIEETAAPVEETAAPSTEPQATELPKADAYLVVSVRGLLYEPIPLEGEGSFTIKQDENTTNTIHVTPDSIRMEHSTCDNQDCVDQGVVTLENMETRVLSNMIICLPNEVVLELHTPETLETVFGLVQ